MCCGAKQKKNSLKQNKTIENTDMKHLLNCFAACLVFSLLIACGGKQNPSAGDGDLFDSLAMSSDTTMYGVCGEGTSMNNLQLITDMGDTLNYLINVDDSSAVMGGLLVGDRLALIAGKNLGGDMVASLVVNITSLLGKWTSIDRNFEICEGGEVRSTMKAESNPWVSWKILNGRLLLNTDTFDIVQLGADSLALENPTGIFMYKRQSN